MTPNELTVEIEDFDPSTGHRHRCPWNEPPTAATGAPEPCDCSAELYGLAARSDERILAGKLQQIEPGCVVAVTVADAEYDEQQAGRLRGSLVELAGHERFLLVLLRPGESIGTLDVDAMEREGWYR